jgi:glucose-1-phosphate cytidylyltransferase
MKVVLFCGGMGMRIRDAGENVPKPMIHIGNRPILWHLMKYYAHFGHKDFILCLGYRGDVIKDYFLRYNECISNDFVLSEGGRKVELMGSDTHDWTITFVDTGLTSNIGQRLKAVERFVRDEPLFLANYTDGLSDLPLPAHVEHFRRRDAIASFVSVKPNLSYHMVSVNRSGLVDSIEPIGSSSLRTNGGFFVLRPEIFDVMRDGEELVCKPFERLVTVRRLAAYEHPGFWMAMDTFKDFQQLQNVHVRGHAPWEVWNERRSADERTGDIEAVPQFARLHAAT